jgi:hypothetical protein
VKSASCAVVKTSGVPPAAASRARPARHRGALVQRGQLCLAAASHDRHHAVALLEAEHAVAEPNHLARKLEPGNVGGVAWRRWIAAVLLHDVGAVEPAALTATSTSPFPGMGSGRLTT